MKDLVTGTIIRGVGGNYYVDCGGGIIVCRAGGRLRLTDIVPYAGDRVDVEMTGEEGYILNIQSRKNALSRPAVANIDRLFILCSQADPKTDLYLIDKISVIALAKHIRVFITINKCDIHSSDEIYNTYTKVGFPVLRVSALTGEGLEELRRQLAGKTCVLTGNSGIGKSSLLNKLNPDFSLITGDISRKIARGKNTTRHVELFPYMEGYVVDTPGFSTFDVTKMERIEKDRLQNYFPEIERLFGKCRFSDCTHRTEPDCAVLEYIQHNPELKSRHNSYCALYEELAAIKKWET